MGVIHKLKEDVVYFIIDQKKKNPSVSIRRLAAETSAKFQIKVSKSSVSTTLKNASLSSAVGRRVTKGARGEKFAIPPVRKIEISQNMQKAGFDKDAITKKEKENGAAKELMDTEEDVEVQPVKKEELLPLIPDRIGQEKPLPADSKDKEETTIEDASQDKDFLEYVERLRIERKSQNIPTLNGMGFVFLKAAQWETSSKSLISELFKKHVSGSAQNSFDIACDMFLFLKFLGVGSIDHVSAYQEHGLWQLNKIPGPVSDEDEALLKLKELFQWSSHIPTPLSSSIVMEYDLEKKHIFSQVSGFELYLEDNTSLVIDAAMSTLDFNIKAPINRSMTWLSHYLISNIQSPVFLTVPEEGKFDQRFYDMIAIFENFPEKKIQKIVVLDQDNKSIAEFSTIFAQRRTFIAGVKPQQKEFRQLTKNVKWAAKKPYYHQESDRIVYYGETKTDSLAAQFQEKVDDFRVITIWQNKDKDPFWAILTNQSRGSSEDILKAYISRWPYFGVAEQVLHKKSHLPKRGVAARNTIHKSGILEFQDISSDYVQMLNQYCQKYYFPPNYSGVDINNMIQMVYDTQGSFYEAKDHTTVLLEIPTASVHRKDIEYALRRVNERYIFDHLGRKLWIKI